MVVDLRDHRLIYVGPRNHVTAIGDYTEDLVAAYRSHFGDVAEVRVSGPGDETWADVRRVRKQVRELVASWPAGKVLVHSEIGCGMLSPFWSIAGLRASNPANAGLRHGHGSTPIAHRRSQYSLQSLSSHQ